MMYDGRRKGKREREENEREGEEMVEGLLLTLYKQ